MDWAPAYELVASLGAFADTKNHAELELGPRWVKRVRQRLPAHFQEQLAAELHPADKHQAPHFNYLFFLLLRECPGERDAASYLAWLEETAVGELYERLAPHWPEGSALPRDLGVRRERLVSLLRVWNECYFSHVDPVVLTGLRGAARQLAVEARAAGDPFELIDRATNGLVLGTSPPPEVVLVPQHHLVPFNVTVKGHGSLMMLYPAEVAPAAPDAPPASLRRLARALADESRLRILRHLSTDEPRSLTDLSRALKLAQSTVHHHLLLLRIAGLVRNHVGDGHTSQYTLRPHAVDELGARLRAYLAPRNTSSSTPLARRRR